MHARGPRDYRIELIEWKVTKMTNARRITSPGQAASTAQTRRVDESLIAREALDYVPDSSPMPDSPPAKNPSSMPFTQSLLTENWCGTADENHIALPDTALDLVPIKEEESTSKMRGQIDNVYYGPQGIRMEVSKDTHLPNMMPAPRSPQNAVRSTTDTACISDDV